MTTRSTVQIEASQILLAQRAAKRLKRQLAERNAVQALARDELAKLATQLEEVSAIAERLHLERATAGGVAPEVMDVPTL